MSSWGKGMTQEDMMIKDECILLSNDDEIIGHGNKKSVHIFSPETPRGKVHRAFSVFLFNSEGKLLLQQRAADKITFPNVWTNTCCSHPLFGFTPNEVDKKEDLLSGQVPGVKNAAIRKLEHELGINPKELSVNDFKFLTRLHYWAADVVTHGPNSPWGEHEIDYILFVQKDVTLVPNPEEVSDVKYVSYKELMDMMKPSTGLLWSPWFRIIAEKFLSHWMKDLNETLTTDLYTDYNTIYRFDPTEEHMGGAGNAREWLGKGTDSYGPNPNSSKSTKKIGDTSLKQGAYGKVKIHKHSKLEQISHIDEIFSALYLKFFADLENDNKVSEDNESIKFCNDMLGKVSRSFASVIRQLPRGLCLDILMFYLALRALDTIEDDMTAFKGREHVKIDHLNNFYRTGLVTDGWTMEGVGEGDEKRLLEEYHHCVKVFKSLPASSQEVIADITRRMGEGMASYVEKDLGQGTVTVNDYNIYCHYVAGLVGEGLSRLFTSTGYESDTVRQVSKTLANTMGLFLQKTNIIRDYLEDYVDGRAFWPQEIWKKYSTTGDLGEFAREDSMQQALNLLNHLVMDALHCVPECLEYMDLLHTEEVFRFCAIPQVMAIGTLAELYNNPKVFTGVVKIRKGLAAKMILDTSSREGLHKWFYLMAQDILSKIPRNHSNNSNKEVNDKTRAICQKILSLTEKEGFSLIKRNQLETASIFAAAGAAYTGNILMKAHEKLVSIIGNSLPASDICHQVYQQNFLTSLVFAGSVVILGSYVVSFLFRPDARLKKADH